MSRLGLFLFSESENIVDDYVYYLLDDLRKNIDYLCVILTDSECKKSFEKYSDDIIVKSSHDVAIEIWKDVLANHFGFEELKKFDEIILFDNSFFGPISSFKEIFAKMEDAQLDFWTILSDNTGDMDYPCNFQFIVFKNSLIETDDFEKYWTNINESDVKKSNYEAVFIDYFTGRGYEWNNYLNMANSDVDEHEMNFYTFNIHELLAKYQLPLINITSFRFPKKVHLSHNNGQDLSLTMDYLKNETDYDVSLIYDYLLRVMDPNVLVDALNLRKIVPKVNADSNYNSSKRIAVICHVYYVDLLDYVFDYLKNIPDYVDVIITTNDEDKKVLVEKNLLSKLKNDSKVILVNARGRDMAGLFVGCKNVINDYDYFCFMHDKKSAGKEYLTVGASFRDSIWENMLASEDYINSIIRDFDDNASLGLIVPPPVYHGTYFNAYSHKYWVSCFDLVEDLFEKMGIDVISSKSEPPLSIGNCFWAKVDALRPLFDLDLDYEDFPPEPMPGDGTISHALERIYGYVAASQGYCTEFFMTEEYGRSELTNYKYMMGETLGVLKDKNRGLTDSYTPFNSFLDRLSKYLTKSNKSQKAANRKDKEIEIMKNSNSWKMTKPLRKVSSLFKGSSDKKSGNGLEKDYFVSIIMATYNRKELISDSIDSVLNQTFKHFELIIVDDGSDDGTEEFIKGNYSDFDNFRYLKINHEGLSHARNYALERSEGNVIAYLDSDNKWNPKFLESMLKKLKKSKCAYCGANIEDKINGTAHTLNSEFNRKKLLKRNFIYISSFIHKKELYNELGGFDESLKRFEDWDLIIRYTKDNAPVHVKDVLVNHVSDDRYETISNTLPQDEYTDIIHERYWMELYNKEYNIIKNDFDEDYYVSEYGEQFSNILTSIHHFLSDGYKEGKNPNKEFNTLYYRNQHKKIVKNEDMNPFVYYIQNGKTKGHKINYYDERNRILNTNLTFLSNYEFDDEPLVSIIILNKDGLHHLKRLFKDFSQKTNYSNFEIIVVDNASEDGSVDYLKSLNLNISIIENKENVSFAKGNNDAVKMANGEYILLLNNDIEPTYGWLNEMMGTIIYNDNVASVGAKLIYPFIEDPKNTNKSFTIQHAGDILRETKDDICLYKGHNQNKFSANVFDSEISINKKRLLVTAAVLLVKKSIYDELGGLDESYWYGYEDIDFNLRVHQAGYDTMFAASALLFHHESATRKTINRNNHKVFCQKWSKYLFKKLLQDKIEKNYFFTDKKLDILLVGDSNFGKFENVVHDFVDNCVSNNYNVNVNLNSNDLNISDQTDIIVSFCENYDIKNVKARQNVIKILVCSKDSLNGENSDYDILIEDTENLTENIFSKLYGLF